MLKTPVGERIRSRLTGSNRWTALKMLWAASKGWTGGIALLVVATAVVPNLVLIAMGRMVAAIPAAVTSGLSSSAGHYLVRTVVVVAVFYVLSLLIGPYEDALTTVVQLHLSDAMQERLMAAVSGPLGIGHLEDTAVLDQLTRAQGQATNGDPASAPVALASVVGNRLGGLLACAVLAAFQWWLGLVMLVMWLVIRRPLRQVLVRQITDMLGVTSVLRRSWYFQDAASGVGAAKELRVFGLGDWIVKQYRDHWLDAMAGPFKTRKGLLGVPLRYGIAVVAVYLGACVELGYAALHHHIGVGTLSVMLPMLVGSMAVGNISSDDLALERALAGLPDVAGLEACLASTTSLLGGTRPAQGLPALQVRFSDVHFTYPATGIEVLSGLDLTIPAGRSMAIVGLNGAGKTTLVKLITRLHDPTSGAITVDGIDLSSLNARQWQHQVAVVFQDFNCYPVSAWENIGLGALAHLDDRDGIVEAARRAGALDVVSALPSGWDTILSRQYTGGADLSGGQWQRLALARALFAVSHGARILVLDEPTASLDVRAEAEFFDRFLDITGATGAPAGRGRSVTAIVISHRFSTVRRADRICVLAEGRVLEEGTHSELMALGGRYADMYSRQAARFAGTPGTPGTAGSAGSAGGPVVS